MTKKFGSDWIAHAWSRTKGAAREIRAVEEILWRAAENGWFEYPFGSTLMYFCFPARYRRQALEGVKVYFTREGPTSKRTQPRIGPDEKIVLRKKIQRFIERRYIGPTSTKFKSSIKYFAVPKGKDSLPRVHKRIERTSLGSSVWPSLHQLVTADCRRRVSHVGP